jgi:CBS domain-containing protein
VCRPDDNLAEVAATMWHARCGALPVLDRRGAVTSMITDRDICIALGARNLRASEVKVKDVSPPRVFSCGPNDDVRLALNTMTSQGCGAASGGRR